jgi:hypothetical protein
MANRNNRDKKEHFDLIQDILNDNVKLAIAIIIIILIGVVIYLLLNPQNQSGAGMMELLSETSPMAPLTNTPSL